MNENHTEYRCQFYGCSGRHLAPARDQCASWQFHDRTDSVAVYGGIAIAAGIALLLLASRLRTSGGVKERILGRDRPPGAFAWSSFDKESDSQ
jgi:hypothetical protein